MSLVKYIKQRNAMATWFKGQAILPEDTDLLLPRHKLELAQSICSDLSPENLCCDGELRGAKLRAKAQLINGAKRDLEALGQSCEWDVLYPPGTFA